MAVNVVKKIVRREKNSKKISVNLYLFGKDTQTAVFAIHLSEKNAQTAVFAIHLTEKDAQPAVFAIHLSEMGQ